MIEAEAEGVDTVEGRGLELRTADVKLTGLENPIAEDDRIPIDVLGELDTEVEGGPKVEEGFRGFEDDTAGEDVTGPLVLSKVAKLDAANWELELAKADWLREIGLLDARREAELVEIVLADKIPDAVAVDATSDCDDIEDTLEEKVVDAVDGDTPMVETDAADETVAKLLVSVLDTTKDELAALEIEGDKVESVETLMELDRPVIAEP